MATEFIDFLKKIRHRGQLFEGDYSNDFALDASFDDGPMPSNGHRAEWIEYLLEQGAVPRAVIGFKQAWAEYRRYFHT